jgi:hypothetical protein
MVALKAVKNSAPEATEKRKTTVAEFLAGQIALAGVQQNDLAKQLGYDKPNIITMFKQGTTKLPLNKVGPMAKALHIDPVHLLRRVMQEYYAESWASIEEILTATPISANEAEILAIIRSVNNGDPGITSDAQRNELRAWAKTLPSVRVPKEVKHKK